MYAYEIIWGVIYLVSNKVRAGVNGWKRYLYQLLCLFIIPIYILNAIESIGKQTYKNWKLIVNENGSRDRLIFVTNKYIKKNKHIKLIKNNKNLGIVKIRNYRVEKSYYRMYCCSYSDDV